MLVSLPLHFVCPLDDISVSILYGFRLHSLYYAVEFEYIAFFFTSFLTFMFASTVAMIFSMEKCDFNCEFEVKTSVVLALRLFLVVVCVCDACVCRSTSELVGLSVCVGVKSRVEVFNSNRCQKL